MEDPVRTARLLLESATSIAHAIDARAILVPVDALPDLDAVPPHTILVVRDEPDRVRAERLDASGDGPVLVPDVELDRLDQVKLAAIIALANGRIGRLDDVIFLTGPYRSLIDTLVVTTMGAEYELLDTTEQPDLATDVERAVFHRVLTIALELGLHGREGRRVGALLVVGDEEHVLERCEQMILNPFKGYGATERNVLDEAMAETVKEFSSLDGAFVIAGSGVIETAGARLKAGQSEGVPAGLGARHRAAAGITSQTEALAVTVSQSDGTVRVWRSGRMVASFEAPPR